MLFLRQNNILKKRGKKMRTQPQDIIKKLEADNSRLAKEAVLLEAMEEGLDEFFVGLRMALDPLVTFGVKQVPDSKVDGQGLKWEVFKKLADQLQNRELTGHDARDAILLTRDIATAEQWNMFYRRILIKDLRCGVSEKTVNKVAKKFPQYSIPVFTCPLAHDSANHEKKMVGKKQIEVKLDGVRVITIIRGDKVEMFSRNGKQFHNFGHIITEIEEVLNKYDACKAYHLPEDRSGDIVCMSSESYTIGSSIEKHDLSSLKEPLRSHGGLHEREVPFIINSKTANLSSQGQLYNYDAFYYAIHSANQ